ncbi:MAG: hypothetical protein AMXMBFR67_21330 [Nitrospira sp.]
MAAYSRYIIKESCMSTLSGSEVPVGGFRTVGQIDATNTVLFGTDQNGLADNGRGPIPRTPR